MSEAPAIIAMFSGVAEGYEAETNDPIDYIQYVRKDIFDAYKAAVDDGAKLLDDLRDLMQQSTGVAGLHLNGDLAEWDTLTAGGRFEEWLVAIDTFRESMQAARRAGESVQ